MSRSFRRRVFYLPGYDPIPPRRYRELYRREGPKQAQISGYRLDFGPRQDPTGFGWAVSGDFGGPHTEVEFEVLVWADLVQRSMGQSIPATYGQMLRTAKAYIGSGALFALMKLRRGPLLAAVYPVVVLIGQLLLAVLAAVSAGAALMVALTALTGGNATFVLLVALSAGFAVLWIVLRFWQRLDGRIFAYYLMHDYAFTAQHRGAYPAPLEKRLTVFADRIRQALEQDWDEVLVVGHSSGAYLAVSILADVLREKNLPESGPALSLLTLGHVVPMASFLPDAGRLRRDLHFLAGTDRLSWVDVTAPGDACCFALCDPVAVSGVAPMDQRWPLVISAAFSRSLSERQQKALKWRWFRLHFQYLCAFEQVGSYDYFAITAGPLTLGQRFQTRAHSPGRITRAVNRHREIAP